MESQAVALGLQEMTAIDPILRVVGVAAISCSNSVANNCGNSSVDVDDEVGIEIKTPKPAHSPGHSRSTDIGEKNLINETVVSRQKSMLSYHCASGHSGVTTCSKLAYMTAFTAKCFGIAFYV